ncbi:hypothetical protein A3860_05265 [Niastella vici]|uniref:Carbohydrate-binding protein SusD n=1 Tax=Niastella vici TaxID=1703345 RepID=A0A1V9FRW1_9BACT|nr:RagB/SusD family nutrient uptake outer membrane protein [Niastella vici]OQP61129.1 hypothetical protein A3860_05265 [Niastella vici]
MTKIILFSILTVIGLSSCKKFLNVGNPKTKLIDETVFENEQSATGVLTGIYGELSQNTIELTSVKVSSNLGFAADEMIYAAGNSYDVLINNTYTAETGQGNIWGRAYRYIYMATTAINGLENSGISVATKNQLIGESYFVRAWSYFYLVNIYGDVPLVLSTDYQETSFIPRTPKQEVYAQIIGDLKSAKQYLQPTYPTADKARPNKWTATALLARVYLYLGQWANAENEATDLLSSGLYTPLPLPENTFLKNSKETIWQFASVVPGINTYEGNTFLPVSANTIPPYLLRPNLVDSFESGDRRKLNWIKQNTISGQVFYYPAKYKVRSGADISELSIVFRAAEIYLIRAEARAQQNNLTGAAADLNVIRSRAGLPATTATTPTEYLDAIFRERKFELFTEWGHRWFDLIRTGNANTVLGALKPTWRPTAALFPIVTQVLLSNPQLTQNPGY